MLDVEYIQYLYQYQTGILQECPFLLILIISTATWRIATLLANERGPFGILDRFRFVVGTRYSDSEGRIITRYSELLDDVPLVRHDTTELAKLVACIWCSTPWIAAGIIIAYLLSGQQVIWCLLPFSVSALAIIIERIVNG